MLTVQDVVDLFLDGLDGKTKLLCRQEGSITFEPGYLEVVTIYKKCGGPKPKDNAEFKLSNHGKGGGPKPKDNAEFKLSNHGKGDDREDYLVVGRSL